MISSAFEDMKFEVSRVLISKIQLIKKKGNHTKTKYEWNTKQLSQENIKGMCYLSNEANKERFESDEEFTLYLRSNKTNCLQGRIGILNV